jgi:SET domain-containing protein
VLHPDIIIKGGAISGKGLFAKRKIPKGTIVYRIKNDIRVYSKSQYNKFSKRYRKILEKFANEDSNGTIIHHTDGAKYGNHSCQPNCHELPSGHEYMDVALRDIKKGEELTWDYATLIPSWKKAIKCNCGSKNCRKKILRVPPNSRITKKLKLRTKIAEKNCLKVKQPLLSKKERVDLANVLRSLRKAKNPFL